MPSGVHFDLGGGAAPKLVFFKKYRSDLLAVTEEGYARFFSDLDNLEKTCWLPTHHSTHKEKPLCMGRVNVRIGGGGLLAHTGLGETGHH